MSESEKFECWAVVECMGRTVYSGKVTEQVLAGIGFIRVDVPAVEGRLPFTKLLSGGAIFCITPCSEQIAKQRAAQSYAKPVEIYAPSMQRSLPYAGDDDEGCDEPW